MHLFQSALIFELMAPVHVGGLRPDTPFHDPLPMVDIADLGLDPCLALTCLGVRPEPLSDGRSAGKGAGLQGVTAHSLRKYRSHAP